MQKIGLVARMDKSGLGFQSLRLTRLLNPDRLMLIDSTSFKRVEQYPDWYKDYDSMTIRGFPNPHQIKQFLSGLDMVIACETFYGHAFTVMAKSMGVKTVLIANYEFLDYLKYPRLALPDKIIFPSYWHLDELKRDFNAEYLPTPIFEDEFKEARGVNLKRTGKRYLFINGKTAAHDRNGLDSLYEALPLSKGKFTVTIKAQNDIKKHPDPRLIYDFTNPENQQELYTGFDAMIHPRRYGGQSLPMCEALQSALPVIMPDINPNNKVLPKEWLVKAEKTGQFMTRTMIDIHSVDPQALADKLDNLAVTKKTKQKAYKIGQQYGAEKFRAEYERILG